MRSSFHITLPIVAAMTRLASAGEFDVTGQTCVPDDATLLADSYINTLSPDPFLVPTRNPGPITLHCAIPDNVTSPTHLELYTGRGSTGGLIRVSYIKMSKTDGFITTVSTLTDINCAFNDGLCATSGTFVDAYDPTEWVYFLKIEFLPTINNTNVGEFDYAVVF